MPASEQIAIAPHLAFDAITAGMPGAPLVLLLHGFAESMHCWRAQVACLGDMGYRAIAPSQRGYSPGARPDPREFSHYLIDRLMDDAMAIVAAAGYGEARFHLVGHGWGGSLAWGIPERRRHRRPRRRPRHGRFHRRALSYRGASGRRAFCGGSGAGTGVRIATGTCGRASGVRNATPATMLSCTKRSMTTWPANNLRKRRELPGASRLRIDAPPRHNNRKSPRRCRAMARNWCGTATADATTI